MSLTDPIGDMLTRIRNAQMRRRDTVATPASTMRGRVLDVLKSEGFIRGYSEQKTDNGLNEYEIELKYAENTPVIRTIERVSRPGRRVYRGKEELPQVLGGLGLAIVSTSKGVLSGAEAARTGIGGEVLCQVW